MPIDDTRSEPGDQGAASSGRDQTNAVTSRNYHPADRGGWHPDVEEVSLLALANVLLRRWKLVVGLPLAAGFVAAAISLVIPSRYTATTSFVPEVEASELSLPSGLSGLAAQFGVTAPAGGTSSPAFYRDVLDSRTLRDLVLVATFSDPRSELPGDSAILLDIMEIDGQTLPERLEVGRKALQELVAIGIDNETSVINVRVETRYRTLSADIANLFIDLVNRFNLETRQSNAQERRRFVEDRMVQAQQELREAEVELRTWLEQNRQFRDSPALTFAHERLQRQVTIKQEVYTTLLRQYEEARIQEVNDTPVITVIDSAVPPQEKSSPKRRLIVVMVFIMAGVLGVVAAFAREFVERARERDREEFEEISASWEMIKGDLRAMLPGGRRSG